ncbi:MAG: hypothetical protein Q9209_007827 [Squamulea sp. 1 TL-2023]
MFSQIAIFEASDPNVDLSKPHTPFIASLHQHLRTVLAFDGAQAAYYGQLIEKPHIIIVFVNWDTLDSHSKATKSSTSPAHESSFRTTHLLKTDTPITMFHIPFKPNMLDALQPKTSSGSVGVTELVFVYFQPSPLSQAARDKILQSFSNVEPLIERYGGLTGYRNGWAVEELGTPLLERKDRDGNGNGNGNGEGDREDEKCTVYVNLTGWEDRDSHMRFMETEEFRENQHWFMDVEGIRGAEIVHARFWEV